MEKERRIKVLSLVALIIAVLGLTVAFAALSQTLTINGNADINAGEWNIHFENAEIVSVGSGRFNSEPVVGATSITGIDVAIEKPDDQVGIVFDIKNSGNINAKISSVEISELCTLSSPVESCDWNNDGVVTQDDIDKVNDNLSFVMYYVTTSGKTGVKLHETDILNAGSYEKVMVTLVYNKLVYKNGSYSGADMQEATELPKRGLAFNDLSVMINYVQAD